MIDRLRLPVVDISKVKILDIFNSNKILLIADDAWQIAKHFLLLKRISECGQSAWFLTVFYNLPFVCFVFQIWWLYHDKLNISTNFTKVGNDKTANPKELHSAGISIVNFGYSSIFWDEIRFANISVQFASVKTVC